MFFRAFFLGFFQAPPKSIKVDSFIRMWIIFSASVIVISVIAGWKKLFREYKINKNLAQSPDLQQSGGSKKIHIVFQPQSVICLIPFGGQSSVSFKTTKNFKAQTYALRKIIFLFNIRRKHESIETSRNSWLRETEQMKRIYRVEAAL